MEETISGQEPAITEPLPTAGETSDADNAQAAMPVADEPGDDTTATTAADQADNTAADTATDTADTMADGEPTEENQSAMHEPGNESVIRVKFNKQERSYTAEQAAPLVEMGLKWDSFKETHEKLKFLAANSGKSVGEMVDSLVTSADKALYEQVLHECGGNQAAADKLFEYQKSDRQQRFDAMKSQEQAQTRREQEEEKRSLQEKLTADFAELNREMPGKYPQFSDIPRAVVDSALKTGRSLLDAALRYELRETNASRQARTQQAQAASHSAGSLGGTPLAGEPDMDSFEQAFYTALR
jgi:DNA-binding protein Fis